MCSNQTAKTCKFCSKNHENIYKYSFYLKSFEGWVIFPIIICWQRVIEIWLSHHKIITFQISSYDLGRSPQINFHALFCTWANIKHGRFQSFDLNLDLNMLLCSISNFSDHSVIVWEIACNKHIVRNQMAQIMLCSNGQYILITLSLNSITQSIWFHKFWSNVAWVQKLMPQFRNHKDPPAYLIFVFFLSTNTIFG